jgi:hypothetical protein
MMECGCYISQKSLVHSMWAGGSKLTRTTLLPADETICESLQIRDQRLVPELLHL